MSTRPKVTKAEKDLKLQFIQNMNGNTKCNFCKYFLQGQCAFWDLHGRSGPESALADACNDALNRLTSILRS